MKASDNPFPSLLLVDQAAAPATPAAGHARLYRGDDGALYVIDSDGTVSPVDAGGTSGGAATLVGCRVKRVASLSATTGALTAMPWDGEDYDTDGFHSTSTNTTRLTIPAGLGGTYAIGGGWVPTNPPFDGQRCIAALRLNGTTEIAQQEIPAQGSNTFPSPFVATEYQLAAGDYVELVYYHGSSGTPGITPGKSHLYLRKVG